MLLNLTCHTKHYKCRKVNVKKKINKKWNKWMNNKINYKRKMNNEKRKKIKKFNFWRKVWLVNFCALEQGNIE